MKLNLRQARKLEQKIQSRLDTQAQGVHASVRVLGGADEAISEKASEEEKFLKERECRKKLFDLRYKIRREIELKNEKHKINELLNKKSKLQHYLNDLEGLNSLTVQTENDIRDLVEIKSNLLKNGGSEFRRSRLESRMDVVVLSEETLQKLKEERLSYEKELEKVEDELSQSNIKGKILLDEEDTKLLSDSNIV